MDGETSEGKSRRRREAEAAREARREREAAALRENLRRRKAQARARDAGPDAAAAPGDPADGTPA